ncbi:MAG: hypothetical protein II788_02270 [Acholeplasmatales bacterium]|nr:hypothetical protein [Acholeplasmatales bacterium]
MREHGILEKIGGILCIIAGIILFFIGIFSDYDKARNIIEGIVAVIVGIIYIGLANNWLIDAERLTEAERKIEALESKNEDLMKKIIRAGVLEANAVKPIETKTNDIEKQFVSCPHCGFKNPKGAKECSSCYKPLENK